MGAVVRLHDAPPALLAAVAAGLGRYPDDLGLTGEMLVRCVVVDDDPAIDPAWPRMTAADGAAMLVVRCGSAVATLQYATGDVLLQLPESILAVQDALRLLVESVFTAYHVRRGDLHAVHSALVAQDGVGLVLRGPSGAGKSTLTYSCLRRGMSVCSDDWLYAPARRPAGRFAGYPWRMMMTEDAASRFAELASVATVPHPAAEGRKVPVLPPEGQQLATSSASAVVLLDPSPELSLVAVDAAEALERFWAPALPTEREHLTDAWVRSLLDRPVYVLRRGTDPQAAAQVLADLAVSLR
ncbi:MAG: hypothetical protein RJA49_1810 [Actinomycetota bacterium]